MFSKNLKYYRLKRNMTKSALADACGVSSMAISNYEKGIRNPDMETINKLANVLDVKIADFLEVRNASITFEHKGFRKHSALPQGTQEFIREAVEEYFNRFFNAVECVGGDPLPEPIKCGSLIPSGDYAADAKALRAELGFPKDGPIKGLKAVLENKGILVLEVEVGNSKFSGMNGTVNGYPYIVVNKKMTEERIRSTIAHELVHIMFDIPEDMGEEDFANKISGAFLISRTDLERELGIKRKAVTNDFILVCKEYGVSMLLLVLRAKQAGILSDYVYKDFFMKASKAGWRKKEPTRIDTEELSLFRQLVYRAIAEDNISVQKGAELLREPYNDVEINSSNRVLEGLDGVYQQ